MNIRKIFGYGILAVMLMLAGCGDVGVEINTPTPNTPNNPTPNTTPVDTGITYTAVQTGGTEATADSTGIVFTFAESIDSIGLTATDIAVTGVAEKGGSDLTGSGTTWTLPITVNSAGNASVKITKAGIEAATKSVVVYKVGQNNPKILSSISASFDDDYTVYTTTPLDHLKNGLTVTATYTDTSTAPVAATDYTLNGNISTAGKKTITVSYTLGTVTRTTTFSVTVELPPPYAISLAPITFSPVTYGYSAQTAQEVVISNIGTEDTGELTIEIDDSNAFMLSENTHASIDSGDDGSFTVTPNTSLDAGDYTATITVSNSENDISQSIDISFTVYPVYPTLNDFTVTGTGTVEWDGDAKTVTVTENGSNWGSITVLYNGSETAPINLGSYTVTFSVAASGNGNYAGGTLSAGTLTIARLFSNVAAVTTYLQEADGGNSADDPINLTMHPNFNMGDMPNLIDAIGTAEKYVNLDFSAYTMSGGTEFTTSSNRFSSGRGYIVSLQLPNGVTTINGFAFQNFTSLTAIIIPDGVTSINSTDGFGGAFRGCTSLTSVFFGANSQLITIGINAFGDCSSLTSINIPAGVTSIGASAFYSCTSLTSINIPAGVTSIGGGAFAVCRSLTSITIPASVTSIDGDAFWACTSLTSVTFAGPIAADNFHEAAFPGDLRNKFYATAPANGTPGTYIRAGNIWTKQ